MWLTQDPTAALCDVRAYSLNSAADFPRDIPKIHFVASPSGHTPPFSRDCRQLHLRCDLLTLRSPVEKGHQHQVTLMSVLFPAASSSNSHSQPSSSGHGSEVDRVLGTDHPEMCVPSFATGKGCEWTELAAVLPNWVRLY